MKYAVKLNEVEAFQSNGVEQKADDLPNWAKVEWEAERLYIGEYGKEGKKGLFYSRGGKTAYKRYYVGAGSYLVKWPDGTITSVEKSVFERVFQTKER